MYGHTNWRVSTRSSGSGWISILVFLIVLAGVLLLTSAITWLMWWWVVPDIFGGMVKQGLIPATLSLWQAFKLSVFITLILARGSSSSKS